MNRHIVELTRSEREELMEIATKGTHRSQKVLGALILLGCDRGEFNRKPLTGKALSEALKVSGRKVDRVKKRFVEDGMEAALGERQGRRERYDRKADGEFEAHLLALCCSEPPEGRSQWTLNLLADKMVELGHVDSVSYETVRKVLKKTRSSRGRRSLG